MFFFNVSQLFKWWISYLISCKTRPISNNGKVVLCGNGPSIKNFEFEKYINNGYDICCVNFFPLDNTLFFKLKPRYYVCVDPAFHFEKKELTDDEIKLVNVFNQVDWSMKYVCLSNRQLPINNKNIEFDYINHNVIKGGYNRWWKKMLDKNEATFGYQNVISAAIYYFIMSGVEKVLLTGVENDWHKELVVDENNEVFRVITHFYGNERISVTKAGEIAQGELYKYFQFYTNTLYQYNLLAQYSNDSNTEIINTCADSYIDVFRKEKEY